MGENVRSAETVYTYENAENVLFEQLSQVSAPKFAFSKIKAEKGENGYEIKKEAVYTSRTDLKKIITDNLPEGVKMTGDKGIKLIDVKNGAGVITGANNRAVLIAVYRFLRELGCRWLRPGAENEVIPKKKLHD